jgi:hypothetical protein
VSRLPVLALAIAIACAVWLGSRIINRRPFPPDRTPEGAYARIALAVGERRPQDAFAYLETEAQWASFTILKERRAALARVRQAYPPEQARPLVDAWRNVAEAPDGPDVFARLAQARGWIARLERDLSGVAAVEIQGERASVVTAQGTRYPFRRRDNGIWGLTTFTAELQAEADKASRDLEVVERAADDYERAGVAEAVPRPRDRDRTAD